MNFILPSNPGGYVAPTVPLVMLAWIPVVIYLFSRLPARNAIVISFMTAWLFLPEATLELPGLPDYTKMSATCVGVLLATFIFDVGRFSSFKLSWIDIPILIWCLCPFASSITNGLGPYDGLSAAVQQTTTWGIPYFLGRIYLNDLEGLKQLALGIFAGGVIYIPLCLFEVRMSPQLHRIFYGDHAFADFSQSMRLGGFRPTVFMRHGLAVGAFMMAATLIGIWLWQSNTAKNIFKLPVNWVVPAMLVTFTLLKSTGAYALLAMGLGIMWIGKYFRTALPIFLLAASIGVYLYINAETDTYFTDQLVSYLSPIMPPDRISSLQFRFDNEELLATRARERILFGWGGWDRAAVLDENGMRTIQDSLWIIAFGENGTVGLVSYITSLLLPVVALFTQCFRPNLWFNPKVAPAVALGVCTLLYAVDTLLNAMVNPIYILGIGGIAGVVLNWENIVKTASKRRVLKISGGTVADRSTPIA